MGKTPVRLKEVIYMLSPHEQRALTGLFHDMPGKLHKKISENWTDIVCFVAPVVGTVWYANDYIEKEKHHHRF
ncbi:hypothetical protein KFL_001660040 [Klebsormidium nitens]|uniref:Cytochrome b-c1 complex subunit 8 n=1 Tax=Klebsormidium nitens TaxID=105231 RepID=A0A1Y1I570_KLENI|nr:hypothetical protein KFL_001660040 [Klebsormidium nitens]|eukprot:GAQ83867.1 hypothetical protein KFL_001660040 [Klebsormidium nitens]